jgi:hypothetical protein
MLLWLRGRTVVHCPGPVMMARELVSIEPLNAAPGGPYADRSDRESALSDAFRGVQMGAHDERFAAWCVWHFDLTTLRTLVSIMERVRRAGLVETLDLQAALIRRRGQ